ncbi:MAG: S41 family peptidase [Oscillospiraceae bacterium]
MPKQKLFARFCWTVVGLKFSDDALYIKVNMFEDKEYQTFAKFASDIQSEVNEVSPVKKTIIDARDNMGGRTQSYDRFIEMLSGDEFGKVYVLINDGSISRAVVIPALIKQNVEGAVIVDGPSSEPPNGVGYMLDGMYRTPNNKLVFAFGSYYINFWPGYEYDALMPDIEIYQTIEDYANGVDTVLEAVLAMHSASE